MALFTPRTQPEIIGDMIARLLSSSPLTDINYGSVWTTMLEAAAQEDDEQYFQMLELIRNYSLDTTSGTDLDDRAFEYGITRNQAATASTRVTIGDSAISKVETGVYSGLPGSPVGANYVHGDAATGFPASGSIVVGRNTPNAETVVYSSITNNINYVTFNLTTLLAYDHGTDESIILAQGGNRLIPAGTLVKVPASDINAQIDFSTDAAATILDGDQFVIDVPVTASLPGSASNVPVGSIIQFDSPPFSTATVTNPFRVTNGQDIETDQELRDRIKAHIQSLSRGTPLAITSGVTGVLSEEENKRVVSASLIEPTVPSNVVKLYIDDGTGFIPSYTGVGLEEVVPLATGGEKYLYASNVPMMKAFAITQSSQPFTLSGNETLFVSVGGQVETITFASTDFAAPGGATAQEVLTVINKNASLFEARLTADGSKVRIFARADSDEQIQVTGGTANAALSFPTDIKFTAKLFLERDNVVRLLNKDGITAKIESGGTANYNFGVQEHALCVVIDNKVTNPEYVLWDGDAFSNPVLATALEVVNLINDQLAGAGAIRSSNNTRVTIASNTERSASSGVRIVENFSGAFKYTGVYTDALPSILDSGVNTQLFTSDGDVLYLGHTDVHFGSIYIELATPASAPVDFDFQYWNGLTWKTIGMSDTTVGFTVSGFMFFRIPRDWSPTSVNGSEMLWVRIARNMPVLATPPTESSIRICSANQELAFSELMVGGADKDYTLNRFIGQIELESTLNAGDRVTLGSTKTRASLISTLQNYGLNGGETLTVEVDGVPQTATFLIGDFFTPGSALASEVVARLNLDLEGATASVISNRVFLRTNSYTGTLRVTGGVANTFLQFSTALQTSLISHIPSTESANAEPYVFTSGQSLIVIVDGNLAANYTVPMFTAGTSAVGTTSALIIDPALQTTYPLASDLVGYDVLFTSGPELGNRREVASYFPGTGTLTLASSFGGAPGIGETFEVLPKDARTVVRHMNNKQVTLLSVVATIAASSGGTKVEIASRSIGEAAAIFVTGGTANAILAFPTEEYIGVDGYRYFTGLAQRSQWTVDGREDDQDTFPGIRAAGVQVEVIEPVTIPIRIEISITTREGVTLAAITNDIRSAVSAYVNTLPVGADVIVSAITCAAKEVSGVFDVSVTAPASNIAIADNELARVRESEIVVG